MPQNPSPTVPTVSQIRDATEKKFGQMPCLWQCEVVQAILRRDKDVILTAATGSGKTLTFWMPLLFDFDSIQIVCAPLNILGTLNVQCLAKHGIRAIAVTAENATSKTFHVRRHVTCHPLTDQLLQDIANLHYRVVLTNIETLMKPNWGFADLWKNRLFMSKLLGLAFDEGHCISKWAGFRQDYKQVERLRYLIPSHVRFYVVSATFPAPVLRDVMELMHIRHSSVHLVHRSNDRPNIALTVWELVHPANSFLDLAFLVPEDPPPDWQPTKFLIFF